MKKTKTQNGITLIALIITIIVLLILAVVTIGAVQKSNIIGYAQNAASDYNKEKEKEESTISGYENLIEQYVPQASRIEYYIMDKTVQKIDRSRGVAIIYNYNQASGECEKIGNENYFEEGGPTTKNIKINVMNQTNGETEEQELAAGAIPLMLDAVVCAYFSDNKLYGADDKGIYSVFELVTDKAEISKIEAAIANIK